MKVLLGTIAWILCTMLVILPILAKPKPPPPPSKPKPVNYPTKTWKIEANKPDSYTTLITSLRSELESTKVCGIPSTTNSPPATKAFILVELTSFKNNKVTVAFRASDVYYVGYLDKLNGKTTRANFVKENFNDLSDSSLFSDAQIKSQLPHEGGYGDLENKAKIGRGELKLGADSLSTSLDKISGADYTGSNKPKDIGKELAKFALVTIQMIAEATRFKYIEEQVTGLGTGDGNFKPDSTVIDLENNWETISKLIYKSSPKCEAVKVDKFPQWDDIKPQVGLLKFMKSGLNAPSSIKGIFGNNYDALEEFIM